MSDTISDAATVARELGRDAGETIAARARRDPGRLLDLSKRYTPDDIELTGVEHPEVVTSRLTGMPVQRTMLGTSTLTLNLADNLRDQGYELLRGPDRLDLWEITKRGHARLRRDIELEIDRLVFVLDTVDKVDRGLALTFVPEAIARMMDAEGPLKISRDAANRADFVGSLCDRAGVPSVIPGRGIRLPVKDFSKDDRDEIDKAKRTNRKRRSEGRDVARDVFDGRRFKINTLDATAVQKRAVATALYVADQVGSGARERKAMLLAGIAEGQFVPDRPNTVTGDATGPWQILRSTAATLGIRQDDVEAGARAFLVGIKTPAGNVQSFTGPGTSARDYAERYRSWSSAEIAAKVEGGGADPSFYGRFNDEAQRILEIWTGSEGSGIYEPVAGTLDRVTIDPGEYAVDKNESYLSAGRRLADEVRYRFYEQTGAIVYASDDELILEDVAYTLREGEDGIDSVRWTATRRRRIDEMRVIARTTPWAAPPGTVVVPLDEGPGVTERWLVREISRDLMDATGTANITLGLPQHPKPEPAYTVSVEAGQDVSRPDRPSRRNRDAPAGGTVGYPLTNRGKIIGTPYAGTHTIGNWQSDNAVDISVPRGTPVLAVANGTIEKTVERPDGSGRFAGSQVTLRTSTNGFFYTHLSRLDVKTGDRVHKGDQLGRSGVANGVPHLHFGVEHGDPRDLIGQRS